VYRLRRAQYTESRERIVNTIRAALLATAATAAPLSGAADADARKNWFDDPFFALTAEVARCSEPLGPLATQEEALRDSHHRAERGTRCHLEGRCRYPSSYDYDREIASNIEARLPRVVPHPSSLWVLVQGRRVWIYGCAPANYRRGTLEKALRGIADVELAMEEIRVGKAATPYKTR
jgi:hypothetical protein